MSSHCKVCGSPINHDERNWINVQFTYTLRVDTLCSDCFSWMDTEMTARNGKKYDPYMKGNPFVIYYEDRGIGELRREKDYQPQLYAPPVFLPR